MVVIYFIQIRNRCPIFQPYEPIGVEINEI